MRLLKRTKKSLKKPLWQRTGEKKRRQQWHVFCRSLLWLVALLVSATLLLEVWRAGHDSLWDGKGTFYLLAQRGETSWLVKLDKEQRQAVVGEIPGNFILNVARGFGEYQAKSIYKLGEQEKISPRDLTRESVAWTFGLPVEGFMRFADQGSLPDLTLSFAKIFIGVGKTNLTRWDILRLFLFTRDLRPDQIETFSFTQAPGVNQEVRPDGLTIWKIQEERLDTWLRQSFVNAQLVNEEYSWEVVNATEHSGLANQLARLLRNSGLQVVKISQEESGASEIRVAGGVDSKAAKFFSRFLKLPLVLDQDQSQADIVLIVGEDFWRRCCQR